MPTLLLDSQNDSSRPKSWRRLVLTVQETRSAVREMNWHVTHPDINRALARDKTLIGEKVPYITIASNPSGRHPSRWLAECNGSYKHYSFETFTDVCYRSEGGDTRTACRVL